MTSQSTIKESTKEYLVVADKTSKVLMSTTTYKEAASFAQLIRKADGEVTVFVSTKG